MPPKIASLVTWCVIFWLIRRDIKQKPNVTEALWLPFIWFTLNLSHTVAKWLSMFGFGVSGSIDDGTPLDAAIQLALIIWGVRILVQRRVSLSELIRRNWFLAAYLGFSLVAVIWADASFVSFKRWIKTLGHPIVALVILTEPDPLLALRVLFRRCAYVLVLLSVLFIRYYPDWGRDFSQWTGAATNNGVAGDKNFLGVGCFIFGFFLIYDLLQTWKEPRGKPRRNQIFILIGILWMIGWLLKLAHSTTASVSFAVALAVFWFTGRSWVSRRMAGWYIIAIAAVYLAAEQTFGIQKFVLHILGKSPTLTGRADLWADVLKTDFNPIIGAGYEGFWSGSRRAWLWSKHWWHPNQCHNGYLETYVNLGAIGLFLLIGTIIQAFNHCRRSLLEDYELGRIRLSLLVAIILYNCTEAAFKAMHPIWTMFYIIALNYPQPEYASETVSRKRPSNPSLTPNTASEETAPVPNGSTTAA